MGVNLAQLERKVKNLEDLKAKIKTDLDVVDSDSQEGRLVDARIERGIGEA